MKLNPRSFPHPVVGNRDDTPSVAFQATVDVATDKQTVFIDVAVDTSSETILELVSKGKATFVLHVECSNTLFRSAFKFSEAKTRISISSDNLNDSVEINVFCVSESAISSYAADGAHSDYGDNVFDISPSEVLAVSDGHTFFVESNFDALTKISSIMLIQQSDKEGDGPMEVLFEYERIIIVLPKGDFRDYKIAKMNELAATSLTCTIVLPALIEALHLVKSGDDVTENLRWRKILDRRITELGMTNESMDPLFVAQQLLDLPIRRALSVSKSMIEAV